MTTFFDSWAQYGATCFVVAAAQVVYVLFGFGSGLIAIGILALIVPELRDVVVLVLLISVPSELIVVARSHRAIRWRGVLLLALGIAVGIPIGTVILRFGKPTFLLSLLGAALIVVGAVFLRLPEDHRSRLSDWWAPPTGLVSGLLTGLFGTGGPPLILYYRLRGLDKTAFRGNLMALFLLMTFVRLPSYLVGGLITPPRLGAGLAVLPAVLAGAWIGQRIHVEMSEKRFRRGVSIGLILIGLLLLVRTSIAP